MRKTFDLTHPKIKPARLAEAARHEVKKYLNRERRKALPEGVDFWDFDCRFGHTKDDTREIRLKEIGKCIDEVVRLGLPSFYLEILAKEGHHTKKKPDSEG